MLTKGAYEIMEFVSGCLSPARTDGDTGQTRIYDGRRRRNEQYRPGRMKTFGQVLTEARKRTGLTQKEVAERLRREDGRPVDAPYLNAIEHDRPYPQRTI
jgi:ribosome-binding protein aMBF1 (putative translation factor)